MAEDRAVCPHCYAPIIAKRKTCPKCGRNVSDAPPTSSQKMKPDSGSATLAALGLLMVIIGAAAWVLLR